jgi:hypothetical protein
MLAEHYKMDNIDKRAVMFHRPGEKARTSKNRSSRRSAPAKDVREEALTAK